MAEHIDRILGALAVDSGGTVTFDELVDTEAGTFVARSWSSDASALPRDGLPIAAVYDAGPASLIECFQAFVPCDRSRAWQTWLATDSRVVGLLTIAVPRGHRRPDLRRLREAAAPLVLALEPDAPHTPTFHVLFSSDGTVRSARTRCARVLLCPR